MGAGNSDMIPGAMKKTALLSSLFFLLAFIIGCTKTARLYDLATGAVYPLQYQVAVSGHGKIFSIGMPSGEQFTGEYVVVTSGSSSWGSIYANVNGPRGNTSGNATQTSYTVTGRRGTAIATGNKGTIINCEFIPTSNGGTGACEDNHGAKYKLMF